MGPGSFKDMQTGSHSQPDRFWLKEFQCMVMTDILYEVVEKVPGAKIAGVIGTDGLSVEMILDEEYVPHSHEGAELELSWLAATALQVAENLNVGLLFELMLETEALVYFLSMVTPEYYALLAITPDSDVSDAQSAVRELVERFKTL
jgi:predicted regulator of Ras-like GTPase activity (Roadblock/LC7/MglB family)